MERLGSSDSLTALISIFPPKEEKSKQSKQGYSSEFQAMLNSFIEEDYLEEVSHSGSTEKKRRLTLDQVKALEKNFEMENKLEPERKMKLAEELGLQPRQVAIWFQNRRARWKTKQLEKDYGLLKANYDALKNDYSSLEQEKEALTSKLKELKAKLKEGQAESSNSFRQDCQILSVQSQEGSDLCSREIVKEETDNINGGSSSFHDFNCSSSSNQWSEQFHIQNSRMGFGHSSSQFVKIEEQSLFPADESCNFFSVDQAPTLQWYFAGH